jgi:glycosyltransferase involved in cell wall biosynthesis
MAALPKVVLVGSIDIDARIELMHFLSNNFDVSALGSLPTLQGKFSDQGFRYTSYTLSRGVNPFSDIFTLIQLYFIFRRLNPDLVHVFDTKPCVWARIAAHLAGVPVIIGTLPGLGSLYTNEKFINLLLRSVYERLQQLACYVSDLTIFQNHDDARQFIEAGILSSKNVIVIPGSGVSTQLFAKEQVSDTRKAELRKELQIEPHKIVVTMVSRIIRSKGIFEFMSAAQEVTAHYSCVHFLLVGPEDNDSLDRLDAEEFKQLKQAVTWLGSRQDISSILAISDIFVLPSAYREGIPRVLLEAASMGLPIVTTDSPGCREVVEDNINGFLIPIYDSFALREAVIHLIDKPQQRQRFGQISRQRAVERFDSLKISTRIHTVYKQLLNHQALLQTNYT